MRVCARVHATSAPAVRVRVRVRVCLSVCVCVCVGWCDLCAGAGEGVGGGELEDRRRVGPHQQRQLPRLPQPRRLPPAATQLSLFRGRRGGGTDLAAAGDRVVRAGGARGQADAAGGVVFAEVEPAVDLPTRSSLSRCLSVSLCLCL